MDQKSSALNWIVNGEDHGEVVTYSAHATLELEVVPSLKKTDILFEDKVGVWGILINSNKILYKSG